MSESKNSISLDEVVEAFNRTGLRVSMVNKTSTEILNQILADYGVEDRVKSES